MSDKDLLVRDILKSFPPEELPSYEHPDMCLSHLEDILSESFLHQAKHHTKGARHRTGAGADDGHSKI